MRKRAASLVLGVLSGVGMAWSGGDAEAGPKPAGSSTAAVLAARPGLEIPEALRPWAGWVLHDKEDELCPFLQGESDGTSCVWPSSLSLVLADKGGHFSQQWRVYQRGWVRLPGDAKIWPQEVRVDGKAAVVASPKEEDAEDAAGAPEVLLTPGDHVVSGSFLWDELPESLAVPPATGLLGLTVRGVKLPLPSRDAEGKVWLQREATKVEADVLEMTVHRRISDEIPLLLTTHVELRVSGKSREVLLGRTLPEGFVPMSLESPVPARLESDGRLRVQARAGVWKIDLTARHEGPVSSLARPSPDGPWAGEEVWAFDARPSLRVVTVEGVPAIDPQQTTLPEEWKRLPCYPMKPGDTLQLVEHRRGDSDPAPDQLSLRRDLWLDFDGGGYTVSDIISGTFNRAWRLEVNPPTELGRVAVGGKDQFITRSTVGGADAAGETARAGVEIRQGTVEVTADSRIPGHVGGLPAVSWNNDFHQVEGTLHLPPGWRLFFASGADEVPGTWIRHWTLLDFFLVLIIAVAASRLFSLRWGGIVLITLVLVFPEEDAPRWVWLAVLAAEALVRVLPAGKLRWGLRGVRLLSRIALVVVAVLFAMQHIRHGLYPSLEHAADGVGGGNEGMSIENIPDRFVSAMGEKKEASAGAAPSGSSDDQSSYGRGAAMKSKFKVTQSLSWQNDNAYDPNAMVQTGPGLPRWQWNTVALRYSGPVERGQWLHLWLLPPWANLWLAVFRVLLMTLVVLRLLGLPERALPPPLRRGFAIALALLLPLLGMSRSAHADLPPQPLLDELRTRLLEKPECRPSCASSPRLSLEIQPRLLRARMEVGAAAATAVPLPGAANQWVPETVLLDGKPAPALLRSDDGKLWLQVSEGSHQVLLEGPLANRETVQISLPLKSHRVEAKTDGWRLEGLHEDGLADDDLQLTRVKGNKEERGAALQPGALPPPLPVFVRVEREVQVGLLWQVDTKVVRVTPTGTAVVLEVPLLAGESVTTADVRVQNGKALVNMGPSATEVSWHSLLQERSPIALAAPKALPWVEVWRLDTSPIWHVELTGIPVVHQQDESGVRRPEWHPWPGEEVRVDVSRPEGIVGRTLTIDSSALMVKPGVRATDVTLSLGLRSSRGGEHVLTLPEGAVLQSITISGKTQPIRQDKRRLTLPVTPGNQQVELSWREPTPISTHFASPTVDLGAPSVNAHVTVELGEDRWTLLCGGPRLGPAVLFWSFIVVLMLVALALGQVHWTPLRIRHWLLLGLGLSQVPVAAAGVVAGWLLLLGWRRERSAIVHRHLFNLRQLFLFGWTAVALIVLVISIHEGLLGHPDMQISGNHSYNRSLQWFQDRTAGVLPRGWVLSVPMWVYRLAMLLWALWLAQALLGWLKWGWGAINHGVLWRKKPPRPAPPAPASPLPSATPATEGGVPPGAITPSATTPAAETPELAPPPPDKP